MAVRGSATEGRTAPEVEAIEMCGPRAELFQKRILTFVLSKIGTDRDAEQVGGLHFPAAFSTLRGKERSDLIFAVHHSRMC